MSGLEILTFHTAWGVYSCPLRSVRFYSKRVRKGAVGWFSQLGDSANPAFVLWPKRDAIYLPLFAIDRIDRTVIG